VRIRSIRPEQWTRVPWVQMSVPARLLSLGMRNLADDHGILPYDPLHIKITLCPLDDLDIYLLLDEMVRLGQVFRYQTDNGEEYLALVDFERDQKTHRPYYEYPLPVTSPKGFTGADGEFKSILPVQGEIDTIGAARSRIDHSSGTDRSRIDHSSGIPRRGEEGIGDLNTIFFSDDQSPRGPGNLGDPGDPGGLSDPGDPGDHDDLGDHDDPPVKKPQAKSRIKTWSAEDIERFEEFWSAYPRKVVKVRARKAWGQIDGGLPDADLTHCIVASLVAWQDSEGYPTEIKFFPHPATWLNGRRWDDELPVKTGAKSDLCPADTEGLRLLKEAGLDVET